jgi:hypothetical protein
MLASKYNESELKEKLSFWESMQERPPYYHAMIRDLKEALKLKEESFTETFRKNYGVKHSVYIDPVMSKFLGEHGFSYHFHTGQNFITESQAENIIPYLRGMIPSLHRKAYVKKMNNFLDCFISSYGPDFRAKWINDTQIKLFCN